MVPSERFHRTNQSYEVRPDATATPNLEGLALPSVTVELRTTITATSDTYPTI
jgi:hypothetical protein